MEEHLKELKILIVDDELDYLNLMKRLLLDAGFQNIDTAESGNEALEKVKYSQPEVVLLDTKLPDIDGFEVCAAIKKTARLKIKVILYTAYIDAVNAAKARTSGADEYCAKITDVATFSEIIETFIN